MAIGPVWWVGARVLSFAAGSAMVGETGDVVYLTCLAG
jgi:hypothetical protein